MFPASNDPAQSCLRRKVTQGRIPRFASVAPYGQGMRLTSMATGPPHHEEVDSDEEALYSETAQYHEEDATAQRWYSPIKAGIKWVLSAGHNESSTAERGTRAVYSKLETRRSDELDWRDLNVAIVSFHLQCRVHIQCRPPLFTSPTQAHCQLAALCCFHSDCSSSLIY